MRITEIINSIPEFMWNNIFSAISTLGCGLIKDRLYRKINNLYFLIRLIY